MSRRQVDPTTGLTPSQEAFCVNLAQSGNASDAYRTAFPKSRMNPNALAVQACRLSASPNILLRLSQLRSDVRRANGITLTDHLATLRELRDGAKDVSQFSAAIQAETNRGKVSGLYDDPDPDAGAEPVHKVEIVIVDGRRG